MDQQDAVGDRLDLLQDVGRDEEGLGAAQPLHVLAELLDLVGVEARRGLVHDQHLRVVQQGLGQPHPLLVALRELADGLLEHEVEGADLDDRLDAVPERPRGHLAGLAEEAEQLERRHVGVERPVLGQVAEPLRRLDALLPHVEPGDRGAARARREKAGEHAHQGGLAGPVRPQEGHHLPLGNRERRVFDRDEGPVVLAQPVGVDHGGRGRRILGRFRPPGSPSPQLPHPYRSASSVLARLAPRPRPNAHGRRCRPHVDDKTHPGPDGPGGAQSADGRPRRRRDPAPVGNPRA